MFYWTNESINISKLKINIQIKEENKSFDNLMSAMNTNKLSPKYFQRNEKINESFLNPF